MPAARPLKRRAPPNAGSVDPNPNPSFQLTFASPSSLPSDLPSAPCSQNALALQTTISFAPNVTPGTYTAPPPSDDLLLGLDGGSSHTALFPDTAGAEGTMPNPPAAKRRRKTTPASASRATPVPSKASSKKSSKSSSSSKSCSPPPTSKTPLSSTTNNTDTPAHIPRPPNAFILFRSSFIRSQHVSAETEGNHGTLSKIVGMLWHALSYEERQVWQAKARRAYAEHKRMYPDYSFRPVKDKTTAPSSSNTTSSISSNASGNTNASTSASKSEREATPASSDTPAPAQKRKTRTVGPRDLQRCEHIAALLARGLKGPALDAAMKQFDAARAPQTFTPRFEVPLTAQAYAPPKEKEAKEKETKKESEEEEKVEKEESEEERREKTAEPQTEYQTQTQMPPALALLRPARVRRSSSAPLLDAGLPISAPAPLYPASHTHFFHPQPQTAPFQFGQHPQEHDGVFRFGSSAPQEQDQHQSYAPSIAYLQPHMALRKRSASSSPPLRRPSYSFSYPQSHQQSFSHHFSTPYPHQQQGQQQPLMHNYGSVHPHLQHMQAQFQAHVQGQQESQSEAFGLGLEFDQVEQQSNYSGFGRQQGGLSRQSTLTDLSSEEDNAGINASGSGYWDESVDFGGFSFTSTDGRDSQTPVSAHPTNPNPFEVPPLSSVPSSAGAGTSVDELELEYDYSGMPVLVEPPLYHNYYQPTRTQHPQLEIQTSWSGEEFTFEHAPTSAASVPPSSALEMESVPPSAVSGAFEFPPPSALDLEGGYMDYPAPPQSVTAMAPRPSSPASQSASGAPSSAGARTPIDDTFGGWDQNAATVAASASPVNGFDGCGSGTVEDESIARARALALQAGFRAYLAHAGKMGAFDDTGAGMDGAYEQFARFFHGQDGMGTGIGGMSGFGGEMQTQMTDVM